MKPKWEDAPDWAQWLAMDECGSWWWYEKKPKLIFTEDTDWTIAGGKVEVAGQSESWTETLRRRPTEIEQRPTVTVYQALSLQYQLEQYGIEINVEKLRQAMQAAQFGEQK